MDPLGEDLHDVGKPGPGGRWHGSGCILHRRGRRGSWLPPSPESMTILVVQLEAPRDGKHGGRYVLWGQPSACCGTGGTDGVGVVFGEADLAHAGAVVVHQTSYVLIPHVACD